jgi:hypothetical protein
MAHRWKQASRRRHDAIILASEPRWYADTRAPVYSAVYATNAMQIIFAKKGVHLLVLLVALVRAQFHLSQSFDFAKFATY